MSTCIEILTFLKLNTWNTDFHVEITDMQKCSSTALSPPSNSQLRWTRGPEADLSNSSTCSLSHGSYANSCQVNSLKCWASLVAQWLRIRPPMQGTRVGALVREDPTYRGTTKPLRHSYWAHAPQLLRSACLGPVLCSKRSHRNEKPTHCNKE